MTQKTDAATEQTPDPQELLEQIEQLKRENDRLAREVTGEGMSPRTRRSLVVTLVVIASLLLALTAPALWVRRMVTDTDFWVETMAPLAEEPSIQNAVATAVSDAVLDALDMGSLVERYLPEQAKPLAAPLTGALEGFVRDQVSTFTRSDLFRSAWVETNRVSHKAMVAIITEREGEILTNRGGVVTIRTGPIAKVIQDRLVDRGLTFVGQLPLTRLDREVTVLESPELAQASRALNALQSQAIVLPALALLALAAALVLAADKRKAVLWAAIGALAATILPLQGIVLGRVPVVRYFDGLGSGHGAAAQAAYDIVFRELVAVERIIALVAAVIVVGAVLVGPSRGSLALRAALAGGLATAGARFDFGEFGAFVARNKMALRGTGLFVAAVGGVIPLQPGGSIAPLITAIVVLLIWLGAIEFFGSGEVGDPEAGDPEEGTTPPE